MTPVGFVALVVGGGLAGSLVHEVAHWSVLSVIGREPWIDWVALETRVDDRLEPVRWTDRLAGIAPQLLGVLLAAGWLVAGAPAVPGWPAAAAGWASLTLLGSRADFRLAAGDV